MNRFASLGFALPDGPPNKEYAISDGIVTVILDKSGGINLTEYQGPRRTDAGRRGAFFSNGIWRRDDFFPEPVIDFEISLDGQSFKVPFRNAGLCPFGIESNFEVNGQPWHFALWIRGQAILVEFQPPKGVEADVSMLIREAFTQFHNDSSTWDEPQTDHENKALRYGLFRSSVSPEDRSETPEEELYEACSLVGASGAFNAARDDGLARLSTPVVGGAPVQFAIVFGEAPAHVQALLPEALRLHQQWLNEQLSSYQSLARKVPSLEVSNTPQSELSEIVRTAPLFVRSARRVKNGEEAGFRASTRGYGVWNAWDGQWAGRVMDACEDNDTSRKFLNFNDVTRGPNGAVTMLTDYDFGPVPHTNLHSPPADRALGDGWTIYCDTCAIVNLHEYFFRTRDTDQLARNYPPMANAMSIIHSNASALGLVESCFGGADYSDQMNRPQFDDPRDNRTVSSRLSGVEDAGHLFNAAHLAGELAGVMKDAVLQTKCVELIQRIEANFRDIFFDEEAGFLIDAVWPKDKPTYANRLHKLLSVLSLSGYGELLILEDWERMTAFIRNHLSHPDMGLRCIPEAIDIGPRGEPMKENWLQNATREVAKLARLAGDEELLALHWETFEKHFAAEKVVRENLYNLNAAQFFNLAKTHVSTSWWQMMTTSAWWHAIIESFVGIRWERGVLEYLPGDGGKDVRLTNLHRSGNRWDISVNGRGRWIKTMTINGQERVGTYQLIPDASQTDQMVVIEKTEQPPITPTLLSAGVSTFKVESCDPSKLAGSIQSYGLTRLWFHSPKQPRLFANDTEVDCRWCESRGEGTALVLGAETIQLRLEC